MVFTIANGRRYLDVRLPEQQIPDAPVRFLQAEHRRAVFNRSLLVIFLLETF